jgi:hypothetical protein
MTRWGVQTVGANEIWNRVEYTVADNCVVSPQQRTRNGADGRDMGRRECGEEAEAERGQIAPSGGLD